MVKSFYDPKVEERGFEKGKIEAASEMIRDGEPLEKIKKYTKLDENIIFCYCLVYLPNCVLKSRPPYITRIIVTRAFSLSGIYSTQ